MLARTYVRRFKAIEKRNELRYVEVKKRRECGNQEQEDNAKTFSRGEIKIKSDPGGSPRRSGRPGPGRVAIASP